MKEFATDTKHGGGSDDKDVMDEIGYEDCEYISVERKWEKD